MPASGAPERRGRRRCSRGRFMVGENSVTARNGTGRTPGRSADRRFCAARPAAVFAIRKKQERPWRRNLFVPSAATAGGWKRAGPASRFPARGAARPLRPGNAPGGRPVRWKNGWRPVPACLTPARSMPALLPPRGAYPHPQSLPSPPGRPPRPAAREPCRRGRSARRFLPPPLRIRAMRTNPRQARERASFSV